MSTWRTHLGKMSPSGSKNPKKRRTKSEGLSSPCSSRETASPWFGPASKRGRTEIFQTWSLVRFELSSKSRLSNSETIFSRIPISRWSTTALLMGRCWLLFFSNLFRQLMGTKFPAFRAPGPILLMKGVRRQLRTSSWCLRRDWRTIWALGQLLIQSYFRKFAIKQSIRLRRSLD